MGIIGNKFALGNNGGRPPKFKNPEELEKSISDYFENGVAIRTVVVGKGDNKKDIDIPVPTITGLVLHCGFESRQSFYDYEKRTEFSYIIKKARTFIEKHYEEILQTGGGSAAIFALKNFGWTDKQLLEHTGRDGEPIQISDVERAKRINELLRTARARRDRQADSE